MFLGEYRYTIDEKGRLTIPARFRGQLAEGMVVTRGFDRNLMAFSMDGWAELSERVKALPVTDPAAREMRRRLFSGAVDVVPDRQGRILLPPFLREFAVIDNDVVIAGNDTYLEIWNADAWDPVRQQMEQDNGSWVGLVI